MILYVLFRFWLLPLSVADFILFDYLVVRCVPLNISFSCTSAIPRRSFLAKTKYNSVPYHAMQNIGIQGGAKNDYFKVCNSSSSYGRQCNDGKRRKKSTGATVKRRVIELSSTGFGQGS